MPDTVHIITPNHKVSPANRLPVDKHRPVCFSGAGGKFTLTRGLSLPRGGVSLEENECRQMREADVNRGQAIGVDSGINDTGAPTHSDGAVRSLKVPRRRRRTTEYPYAPVH